MEPNFIGEISMFAGNLVPRQWALCDGQQLETEQYYLLFSVIGYTYTPENERDNPKLFRVPDLRARAAVMAGQGSGLSKFPMGTKGGHETVTLSIDNMPSHHHAISGTPNFNRSLANETVPFEGALAITAIEIYNADEPDPDTLMDPSSIVAINLSNGFSAPFTNRDPYLALNFIIALTGRMPYAS